MKRYIFFKPIYSTTKDLTSTYKNFDRKLQKNPIRNASWCILCPHIISKTDFHQTQDFPMERRRAFTRKLRKWNPSGFQQSNFHYKICHWTFFHGNIHTYLSVYWRNISVSIIRATCVNVFALHFNEAKVFFSIFVIKITEVEGCIENEIMLCDSNNRWYCQYINY